MINDPHIAMNDTYFVYTEGNALEAAEPSSINTFIRNPEFTASWVGNCWPGLSVWIDYLNNGAAEFWAGLYKYDKFRGTNYLYGTWNDMNEPSVFSNFTGANPEIDQLGMPMNNTHM